MADSVTGYNLLDRLVSLETGLCVLGLAVLLYFVWSAYIVVRFGWSSFAERLPTRMAVQSMIASIVIHLTLVLACVLWYWVFGISKPEPYESADSVKVVVVAPEPVEEDKIPPPPEPKPPPPTGTQGRDFVELPTHGPSALTGSFEQEIERIKKERADETQGIQEDMKRDGLGTREKVVERVHEGRRTAEQLIRTLQDLKNNLGKADAETEQQRARWAILANASCYEAFLDHYKGEVATPKPGPGGTLIYLLGIGSSRPSVREGAMRSEKRMRWVCDENFLAKNRAAFQRAGRPLGANPAVLCFFPREFEDTLAKLEKDYITKTKRRKFDPDAIQATVFHHNPSAPYQMYVREVRFNR